MHMEKKKSDVVLASISLIWGKKRTKRKLLRTTVVEKVNQTNLPFRFNIHSRCQFQAVQVMPLGKIDDYNRRKMLRRFHHRFYHKLL